MENKIEITKTVRFYTFGNENSAENLWIILHGYAQLAQFFIKKFETLNPEENFIVAPEGFHRFYINGTSGRVGASWMTKEARLDDISDNHNYLNQLAETFCKKKNYKRKFLLGFSQGGATASRWHFTGNYHADFLILWASVFAVDIPFENNTAAFSKSDNYFVVGNKDSYFEEKTENIISSFKEQKIPVKVKIFDGKHEINQSTLNSIYEECMKK